MEIELKILDKSLYRQYELPRYATVGSAAIDLIAAQDIMLIRGDPAKLVRTGIAIHIGSGAANVVGFILPRSGLGHTTGLILGNSTGVLDEDYQGEIMVSVWNRGEPYIAFERGDRIAQLVFLPILKPEFKIVQEFSEITARGKGGFGSSGV